MNKLMMICLVSLSLIPKAVAADETSDLHRKVLKIRYTEAKTDKNREELEKKALAMLNANSTEEDKGDVYSAIAFIYSEHGWQGEKAAEKSSQYCEEALKHPQKPETAAHLHEIWGGNLLRATRNLKTEDYASQRVRVAKIFLAGLKVALDNLAAKDYRYPGVMKFDCPDNSEHCQELRKKHAQQMTEWKDAEVQNKLLDHRKELQHLVIDLYAREPNNPEEFDGLIKDYVSDPATRDQMKRELQDLIERRKPMKPDHRPGQRKAAPAPTDQSTPNSKGGQ